MPVKWRWNWKTDHIDKAKIGLRLDMDTDIVNTRSVSVWWFSYVLSNT